MTPTARTPTARVRRRLRRAAAAAFALTVAATAVVTAQELRGLQGTLGFDTRLEGGRNLALETPSEGSTLRGSSGLGLRLFSETRTERFSLDTGLRFTLGREPGERLSEFSDPRLRLSYRREGVDSLLSLEGGARRARVDFLRDLDQFVDADGVLVLPEDFADLTGTGRRLDYDAELQLELGREAAPAGVSLTARVSGIDYTDAAANLFDQQRLGLSAVGRLRLSPVLTARIELGQDRLEIDDPARTDRRTRTARVGVAYAIDAATDLSVSIGGSRIDTREFGVTRRSEGVIGDVSLTRALPDGGLSAQVSADRVEAGQRLSLSVGRQLDRPLGGVSGRLGLTRGPDGSVNAIGDLAWRRDLPDGAVSANLVRSVGLTSEDEERITTTLRVNYSHAFTDVSSLALRLSHAMSESVGTTGRVSRTDIGATYRHQITRDWALDTGVTYRLRREGGVGSARAPTLFMGLGREFVFGL